MELSLNYQVTQRASVFSFAYVRFTFPPKNKSLELIKMLFFHHLKYSLTALMLGNLQIKKKYPLSSIQQTTNLC